MNNITINLSVLDVLKHSPKAVEALTHDEHRTVIRDGIHKRSDALALDALCGSGKTYALIQLANKQANLENRFIICCKTIRLSRQIEKDIETLQPGLCRRLDSSKFEAHTDPDSEQIVKPSKRRSSVIGELIQALRSADAPVLIVTHKCLDLLAEIALVNSDIDELFKKASVFIDEAPESFITQTTKPICYEDKHIHPWLNYVHKCKDEATGRDVLRATDPEAIKKYLAGQESRYQTVLVALVTGHKVFVNHLDEDNHTYELSARRNSLILTLPCREVTLMAAGAKKTPFAREMVRTGQVMKWGDNSALMAEMNPDRLIHKNAGRFHVTPVLKNVRASQRNLRENFDDMMNGVIQELNRIGKPFIITSNVKLCDPIKLRLQSAGLLDADNMIFDAEQTITPPAGVKGIWCPPMVQGLNCFKEYQVFVFLCTVRFAAQDVEAYFGIDERDIAQEVEDFSNIDAPYQFFMRGVGRKRGGTDDFAESWLICADQFQADAVKEYIGKETDTYLMSSAVQVTEKEQDMTTQKATVDANKQKLQQGIDMLRLSGQKVTKATLHKQTGISRPTINKYWDDLIAVSEQQPEQSK
ncbi:MULTISPECIES: DEAD/DEAH box helicase family protein [unclassified Leclercia]|uniref:DEAD/DEAH box helicase family protein n=1 Tax=Leclercia barmai TaxID=2785629 RepID=A0ABS7RT23_9ENTR|nr:MULTISPECIES: DEAD/DEAH box helicase family protein [unclassified Leclercia]MBZ0057464.1 DEAD/DEAH box helicase family protein [Leclercia sp. EMC7]MCM5695628.1 DEAD/DEAH box helicase family protein [Leclercia sp. LTM01]MCM5700036.1 DEAD/DEAH box helicase family protein [Leclercia sp. LTM14]